MSKAIFRYLRGEINGFYLTNIHDTLNHFISDIKEFFVDFSKQQLDNDLMTKETLYNIGKFASIFLPRRPISESISSLYLTESKIVDGVEYSERGLFNTETEYFNFYHTSEDETTDINELATETERSSMVGEETLLGYISSLETDVLDDYGKVRPEKVLSTPPTDVAYSDFYGNQFLFLSEGNLTYTEINSSLYLELLKALQYIRYNGTSIKSLTDIISILCPNGLVKIHSIVVSLSSAFIYVYYIYDNTVDVTNKEQRLSLLNYLIETKFNQLVLIEYMQE